MTNTQPQISALKPIVLDDNRRVTFNLTVKGLPATISNVMFEMPDAQSAANKPDPNAPSPYPNVELSILNSGRRQVAALFIIEHKEEHTALTLHLQTPDEEHYIARAEMTYQGQVIDVAEVPFNLNIEAATNER
jgi:hypothetical protein